MNNLGIALAQAGRINEAIRLHFEAGSTKREPNSV